MRAAPERSTLRQTQESCIAAGRELSFVSQPSQVSTDRSDPENPGLLAGLLASLPTPSLLPPSRFGAVSSSADSRLWKEADPSFAYETLDLVSGNGRLDAVILFWVDPNPVQSPA